MSDKKSNQSKEKSYSAENRRKSARLGVSAVTLLRTSESELVGITKLLNLGGLLIEAKEALPLGTRLDITLNLPNSLDLFCAKGEVVYRNNIRGRKSHVACEMGIKFLEVKSSSEQILLDLTRRYDQMEFKHTVFSKEMTTFQDPTIIETESKEVKKNS